VPCRVSRATIRGIRLLRSAYVLHAAALQFCRHCPRDRYGQHNPHKVVEHWDVLQVIPTESKNDNGLF